MHAHLLLKFFTLLCTGMEASLLSTPRVYTVVAQCDAESTDIFWKAHLPTTAVEV